MAELLFCGKKGRTAPPPEIPFAETLIECVMYLD